MSSKDTPPEKSNSGPLPRKLKELANSAGYWPAIAEARVIAGHRRTKAAAAKGAAYSDTKPTDMSSRSKGRAGQLPDGEEQSLWNEMNDPINSLLKNEARSKDVREQIFAKEASIKAKQKSGTEPSIEEIDALSALYREEVKLAEKSKSFNIAEIITKVGVLKGLVDHNEEKKGQPSSARISKSRESQSAMDFDGPSDSPGPSLAENKHIRKGMAASRTSSLPPREKDHVKEEKDEKEKEKETTSTGRTKITFALNAEVAFKPKAVIPGVEPDWIQGLVVKVIGEGKSRRYDVKDPFPDQPITGDSIWRSSASSMVPIPPEGTILQDYEIGKRVLALYPGTSTFYRADVKAMVDGGKKVLLLFDEESLESVKEVPRRFVLDHKG